MYTTLENHLDTDMKNETFGYARTYILSTSNPPITPVKSPYVSLSPPSCAVPLWAKLKLCPNCVSK